MSKNKETTTDSVDAELRKKLADFLRYGLLTDGTVNTNTLNTLERFFHAHLTQARKGYEPEGNTLPTVVQLRDVIDEELWNDLSYTDLLYAVAKWHQAELDQQLEAKDEDAYKRGFKDAEKTYRTNKVEHPKPRWWLNLEAHLAILADDPKKSDAELLWHARCIKEWLEDTGLEGRLFTKAELAKAIRKELEQILLQWEHPSLAPRWIHKRIAQLTNPHTPPQVDKGEGV